MRRNVSFFVVVILMLAATVSFAKMGDDVSLPQDWRSFIHAKSMVIPDKSHDLYGFHHIYVNKKGLEILKKGGKYPQGTIFIAALPLAIKDKMRFSCCES
jgi:hypothetical protein